MSNWFQRHYIGRGLLYQVYLLDPSSNFGVGMSEIYWPLLGIMRSNVLVLDGSSRSYGAPVSCNQNFE